MKYFMLGVTALAVVCLSACGGGGSGGGGMTMRPPAEPPTQTYDTQTAFQQGDRLTIDNAVQTAQAFLRASQGTVSDPRFGSVVQGFYHRSSPVQRVSSHFDGDRYSVSLHRADGSTTTYDTARDQTALTASYTLATNPITNRPAADGYIGRATTNGLRIMAGRVEWSSTDVTDYLSGGYWLQADLATGAAELGAFIDGPAFDMAVEMPMRGTATYTGQAAGAYVARGGADSWAPGVHEVGEFGGRLRLTADFERQQISGGVDQVILSNAYGALPNGQGYANLAPQSSDYELTFGAAPLSQAGTFTGRSLQLTHPLLPGITTTGSWGGQFSGVDDAAGNPRAVAGTAAVNASTLGGSQTVFTGAFYGTSERFE